MKVILSVSDEGYSRNVLWALDKISTVVLQGFKNKSVRYIKNVITEIQ